MFSSPVPPTVTCIRKLNALILSPCHSETECFACADKEDGRRSRRHGRHPASDRGVTAATQRSRRHGRLPNERSRRHGRHPAIEASRPPPSDRSKGPPTHAWGSSGAAVFCTFFRQFLGAPAATAGVKSLQKRTDTSTPAAAARIRQQGEEYPGSRCRGKRSRHCPGNRRGVEPPQTHGNEYPGSRRRGKAARGGLPRQPLPG